MWGATRGTVIAGGNRAGVTSVTGKGPDVRRSGRWPGGGRELGGSRSGRCGSPGNGHREAPPSAGTSAVSDVVKSGGVTCKHSVGRIRVAHG